MLQRHLDHIEAQLRNDSPPHAVKYRGQLEDTALNHAFELLCARHPILRGRIRTDDHAYLLYVPPDHYPKFRIVDGDERTLDHEMNRRHNPESSLTDAVVVRRESGGFVALRMNHAIADGASKFAIFAELWRLYTDIVAGRNPPTTQNPSLAIPPTELLRQRWRGAQASPAPRPADTPSHPIISEVRGRRIQLNKGDTAQLLAAARSHTTSVHALVCGVVVTALRALATHPDPAPMEVISAINLRNLVSPPVGATETTNFLSGHKAIVDVSADSNPLTIGQEIKSQIDAAVTHRELVPLDLAPVFFSQVETPLEQHLARCSISNHGVIPPFTQPPEIAITDFVRPRERETQVYFPRHGVYTYDGRLNIGCSYPSKYFTNDQVDDLVERITKQLHHIPS